MIGIRRMTCVFALAWGLCPFWTSAAEAQITIDPTSAEFDPSPDHSTTSAGVPVVSRYDLEFYLVGAASPVQTLSLGKPAPGTDGKIRVNFVGLLPSVPAVGTPYESTVAAIGPGGMGRSARSNVFEFTGPPPPPPPACAFTLLPASGSFGSAAATGTVTVTAGSGCAWTATESSSWISITSGASGTGNGSVTYSVAANTGTAPRTASLTIAGQAYSVAQAGSCGFTVSPTTRNLPAAGGTTTVSVTAGNGCTWTAAGNAPWLTVQSGASGSGNGTVTIRAAANTGAASRSGTVTVAGTAVTVTEAGGSGLSAPSNLRVVTQ